MRDRFGEFRDRWAVANAEASGTAVSAAAIDRVLHAERIGPGRSKVTFRATLGELPDGALVVPVSEDGEEPAARLIWEGAVWRWTFAGYTEPEPPDRGAEVDVLTPRSIVGAFGAGRIPALVAAQ
jgi:hypothetical protein